MRFAAFNLLMACNPKKQDVFTMVLLLFESLARETSRVDARAAG
jgi:hypothetical protein